MRLFLSLMRVVSVLVTVLLVIMSWRQAVLFARLDDYQRIHTVASVILGQENARWYLHYPLSWGQMFLGHDFFPYSDLSRSEKAGTMSLMWDFFTSYMGNPFLMACILFAADSVAVLPFQRKRR